MTKILPEVARLQTLLDGFVPNDSVAKQSALFLVVERYADIVGDVTTEDALYLLLRSLNDLPDLIVQQFPEGGRRKTALTVVDRLKAIFSPRLLAQSYENFLARTATDRAIASSAIALMEDINFDGESLLAKTVEVVEEVAKVREKILQSDCLSDASKIFLSAQFELIERSVLRFEVSGVGPFRDSIFTSIGKIFVELKGQGSDSKVVAKELIDDLLRIYGLLQVGGDLAKLTAPLVMMALPGPV